MVLPAVVIVILFFQTLNTSHINIKGSNFTYYIENLKYPGTPYDVRVYLKSPTSSFKSDAATLTFVTLPSSKFNCVLSLFLKFWLGAESVFLVLFCWKFL